MLVTFPVVCWSLVHAFPFSYNALTQLYSGISGIPSINPSKSNSNITSSEASRLTLLDILMHASIPVTANPYTLESFGELIKITGPRPRTIKSESPKVRSSYGIF